MAAGRLLGWIVGESTPLRSMVIYDNNSGPPRAGSYVVAEGPEGPVLGIVEAVTSGHRMLPPSVTDPEAVSTISQWSLQYGSDEDSYQRGVIRWLSRVDSLIRRKTVESPKSPLPPGTQVYEADPGLLKKIFAPQGRSWVRLGELPNHNGVEFNVSVSSLTRHLAILAVTGGGKSNTVCVLARRIIQGLRGTMVIFDMHGEYQGIIGGDLERVHRPARINPVNLTYHELVELMGVPENAHNQRRYIRWAWKSVKYLQAANRIKPAEMIETFYKLLEELPRLSKSWNSIRNMKVLSNPSGLEALVKELDEKGLRPPQIVKEDSLAGALNRVEDFLEFYGHLVDPYMPLSLVDVIPPGKLTIFDLSSVDEQSADAIVSHYVRRILNARKAARSEGGGEVYPVPLFLVVEEAHVLIPRDRRTLTKYWAGRVAREGRKFGVGLVLVSQRPKNVDADVLSQTNNKIILRMVEPEDIRYVQRASEELSDDIAGLLPSLNPGEAVVTGKMAPLPGLVKIDYCEGKRRGGDIDVVGEWERYWEKGGDGDLDAIL